MSHTHMASSNHIRLDDEEIRYTKKKLLGDRTIYGHIKCPNNINPFDEKNDFNHSLHFIIPCIKDIKKKVYFDPSDFDNEEEEDNEVIDEGILEYLAHKISSNVRVLEGALTRLFAFASLVGKEINIDLVQKYHYHKLNKILNNFFKKI